MSSLSHLRDMAPPAGGELRGSYVAHRDGRRYWYTARLHAESGFLHWKAQITDVEGNGLASPAGKLALAFLEDEPREDWVRAAVELAIERAHGPAIRAP